MGNVVKIDIDKLESALKDMLAADDVQIAVEAHNVNEGVGTKKVGYAGEDLGPFACANCVHYKESNEVKNHGLCDHSDVIADPDVPKCKDGDKALVENEACCNYFHPIDQGEDE